ncbi:unnamed protein product [Mycena citricolor]|uniref:DNA (cytosine-5-)-methyltransferase n=1 Tax=Mycena citricolor TaxID=2018698 RepID=A0AAD2GWQ4_9AGAR|nr:unnamed protein product [Mycena citricolor]
MPRARPSAFDVTDAASEGRHAYATDRPQSPPPPPPPPPRATPSIPAKRRSEQHAPAAERAPKVSRPVDLVYFEPPPNLIVEDRHFRVDGEEDYDGNDGKPIRILSNFCIFEPAARNQCVSPRELEARSPSREFSAVGIPFLLHEDEDDHAEQENDEEEFLSLSNIRLCPLDYSTDNAAIILSTAHAYYVLMRPSFLYRRHFEQYLVPIEIARWIIESARSRVQGDLVRLAYAKNPRWTRQNLVDSAKQVPYVLDAISEAGDQAALNRSMLVVSLLKLPGQSRTDRMNRFTDTTRPLTRLLGNRDLAVLRQQLPTHVTPLIAEFASGYFQEKLHVLSGGPTKNPSKAEVARRREAALEYLKAHVELSRQQRRGLLNLEFDRGSELYVESAMRGDFVLIRRGTQSLFPSLKAPELKVDPSDEHQLFKLFWFARIVYFNVDTRKVHVQWAYHASQMFLDDMADPLGLFLTTLCEDQSIESIVGVPLKVELRNASPDKDKYTLECFTYDERDGSFTTLDRKLMQEFNARQPGQNCLPCSKKNPQYRSGTGRQRSKTILADEQYHLNDFILFQNLKGDGPAEVGQIKTLRTSSGHIVQVEVKMLIRIRQVGLVEDDPYPERHLVLTDHDDVVVEVENIIRRIHVFALDFFREGELAKWVAHSPFNFYCSFRIPILGLRDQHTPVTAASLPVCRHCKPPLFDRHEQDLEKKFDEQQKLEKPYCLDLFGGTGAFSGGVAQGSRGCVQPTHLVEISPSAAKTVLKNWPNLAVSCQDANQILEYWVKASRGMEAPKQLYDDKTPVPAPLKPGTVRTIFAGLPCQSHSGLNMYRKVAEDHKSNLLLTALSFVDLLRPDYFYIENVPGFLRYNLLARQVGPHRTEGGVKSGGLKLAVKALLSMNYQVRFALLQAAHYGTPQRRVRFLLVAAKAGLPLPGMPQPTHDFPGAQQLAMHLPYPENQNLTVKPICTRRGYAAHAGVTINDATSDLPKWDMKHPKHNTRPGIRSFGCNEPGQLFVGMRGPDVQYTHEPRTSYQRMMRERLTTDIQHITKCFFSRTVERMILVPVEAGANFRALGDHVGEYQTHSATSAVGRNRYRGNQYQRLDGDTCFPTIVTNVHPTAKQGEVLHPTCLRMVTVRELARLQGFPDWFVFVADRPEGSVVTFHRQIGNAVPWQISRALGRELRKALFEDWKSKNEESDDRS